MENIHRKSSKYETEIDYLDPLDQPADLHLAERHGRAQGIYNLSKLSSETSQSKIF